ncbi:DNA polymerase subunit Cdc27-domain-containing protein [Abortiporus biennis]|nr:DNA polymerase subunit Cdc27-domain-containing protein [Abortiporus biennis]
MAHYNDYLTKQLFVDKNIVTFRLLSRQFKIHVNEAKNELQKYLSTPRPDPERAYATYILSGEFHAKVQADNTNGKQDENEMDVDQPTEESVSGDRDGEIVPETKVTLVSEADLESARGAYLKIYSQHIYCLSPSPLVDAGLVCSPTAEVWKVDSTLSAEASTSVGRVVGDVHIGKIVPPPAITSIKTRESSSPNLNFSPKVGSKQDSSSKKSKAKEGSTPESTTQEASEDDKKPATKLKPTGKLDWSKAKSKVKKEETVEKSINIKDSKERRNQKTEETETETEKEKETTWKDKKTSFFASKSDKEKPTKTMKAESSKAEIKRGIKRKSALPFDSDSDSNIVKENPPSPIINVVKPKAKGKRKAIFSDTEDEEESPKEKPAERKISPKPARPIKATAPKGKSIPAHLVKFPVEEKEKEPEKSLLAMMDIDDEQVDRVTRQATEPPQTEEESVPDEDVTMEDSDEPEIIKPPTRKRKEKKVIPVGKNGLKKKRIVKSRMKTDDKGYMVTEDYSSYESVSEEEAEEVKPKKKTAAAKGKKSSNSESPIEKSSSKPSAKTGGKTKAAPSLKRSTSSKTAKSGSLMNFFEKK